MSNSNDIGLISIIICFVIVNRKKKLRFVSKIRQSSNIGDLKHHLKATQDIVGNFVGRRLSDTMPLTEAGITANTTLHMESFRKPKCFTHNIRVKLPNGKETNVRVHNRTTIQDLKHKIQDEISIPFEELIIEHGGRPVRQDKLSVEICTHNRTPIIVKWQPARRKKYQQESKEDAQLHLTTDKDTGVNNVQDHSAKDAKHDKDIDGKDHTAEPARHNNDTDVQDHIAQPARHDKDTDVNGIQDHTAEPARHDKDTDVHCQDHIAQPARHDKDTDVNGIQDHTAEPARHSAKTPLHKERVSSQLPTSSTDDTTVTKPTLAKLTLMKTPEEVSIIESVATQWKELGALLNFDTDGRTLRNIEATYQLKGPIACCQEMLIHWLMGNGKETTWNILIELLEDIGQSELAKKVTAAVEFFTKPTLAKLTLMKTPEKVSIIESVATQWKELGALLNFDTDGRTLRNIEATYQLESPTACCQEMFIHWLMGNGKETTWNILIELLDDIGQSELAKKVTAAVKFCVIETPQATTLQPQSSSNPISVALAQKPTPAELDLMKASSTEKVKIIEDVATQWKTLASLLDFDADGITLKNIEATYRQAGPVTCCKEMFAYWLQGSGKKVTWNALIELLTDVCKPKLAAQVKAAIQFKLTH